MTSRLSENQEKKSEKSDNIFVSFLMYASILFLQFLAFFVNSEIVADYKNALAANDATKLAAILDDKFQLDICGKEIVKKSEFLASLRNGMTLRKYTVIDETASMIRVEVAGVAESEFSVTQTSILAERVKDCQQVIATTPLINENAEMTRKVFAEYLSRKNFAIFAEDYQRVRHFGEEEEIKSRRESLAEWKYSVAEVADASHFRIHDEILMENWELHFTVDQLDYKMYVVSSTSFVVDKRREKIRKETQWLCANATMLNFATKLVANVDDLITAEYRDAIRNKNRDKLRNLMTGDFKYLNMYGARFLVPVERRWAVFGDIDTNLVQLRDFGVHWEHFLPFNTTNYENEVRLMMQELIDAFVRAVNEKSREKFEKVAEFDREFAENMDLMIVDDLKIAGDNVTFLGRAECVENRYVAGYFEGVFKVLEEEKGIVEQCRP